ASRESDTRVSPVHPLAQNEKARSTRLTTRDSRLATVFFTPRVGIMAAGVAVFWLSTGVWPVMQGIAVAANLLLFLLLLYDLDRTAGRDSLAVEREHDPQLSLGTENRITLTVRSLSSVPMHVQLRDGPPVELDPYPEPFDVTLQPGERKEWSYALTPTERGEYRFRDLWVRREGRLGLIVRQWAVPLAETVKVYPNVLETRKYETLVIRGRLNELGLRSGKNLGAGREFASLREYLPDDEFRAIDWNATARRVRLIVRQYEVERSQQVLSVLDCGRLMSAPVMGIGSLGRWVIGEAEGDAGSLSQRPNDPMTLSSLRMTKLDFGVNAALVSSYVALALGDRVGMMTFAEDAGAYVPPHAGSNQLNRILEELYAVQASTMDTSYVEAYIHLQRYLKKRSLLLFFTDMMDPETARSAVKYMGLLARRHLCVCVAVGDPEVAEWASLVPADEEEVYRQAVALTTLGDRANALTQLRRAGVQVVDTLPQTLTAEAVHRYLQVKQAGLL
ncbi:MAG: DUF58 domain-containing protein, partial [Armatimonadetes bacterium]|nr:DUF58 domain-containing protein [Armatimonadota bacterium]